MLIRECIECHRTKHICGRGLCKGCYTRLNRLGIVKQSGKLIRTPYTPWTKEDLANLKKWKWSGVSAAEIGRRMGRKEYNVKAQAHNHGFLCNPDMIGVELEQRKMDRVIAEQSANLPDWWQSDYPAGGDRKEPQLWTEANVSELLSLTQSGMSTPDIARRLSRQVRGVHSKIQRLRKQGQRFKTLPE